MMMEEVVTWVDKALSRTRMEAAFEGRGDPSAWSEEQLLMDGVSSALKSSFHLVFSSVSFNKPQVHGQR